MSLDRDNLVRYIQMELNIDEPINGDTELFSTGMLDSVSMVGLISFIETKGGLHIQPGDVTLDNFDTIDAILAYVASLG
ncbi:Phosphopantetheine attachment site [Paracoccus halophilus]|uniref:Phosphopantetheine attachment site n=1 Tax=Paracoccus halophilus TaxID=376733 RepID=A0A099F7Y1_9RHOB|nr:phosphopantetheine-binding protein [Paracoccus halophilus]KGJ06227.1 phosphopantetheine-containing protein [Paracoccus halophilus]SFA45628.1 Phosphopantetheine attachment site [Paracoccus halophilus]